MDKSDNSIARSEEYFKCIFEASGLKVVYQGKQPDWDKDLMSLRLWVLQPSVESFWRPKSTLTFEPIKKMNFGSPSCPTNDDARTNMLVDKLCDKLVRLEILDGR